MNEASKQLLIKNFKKLYPEPETELNFSNPYELLIAVVLSAQCTDKKVNQVTPHLFKKYPSFKKLSQAKLAEIEEIIRPINYYKTKAKNLIATGKMMTENFNQILPKTHDEMTSLPGVGQKTANVVLGELGSLKTFPVDTHVFRLSHRLGLAKGKNPKLVEEEMKLQFDSRYWHDLHHYLILHGRRVCKAQTPLCGECIQSEICPSAFKISKK